MVRRITITQPSPTCNHSNKRMNPWFVPNTIVMLLEWHLSLHLPPHFSKNHSWYTESPFKLFFCVCRTFSIEILLLQLLEGSLKVTFNLLYSSWRRPTPLVLVFVLRFIFVIALHHKHGKRQTMLLWLSSWDSMMSNSTWSLSDEPELLVMESS